MNGFLKIMNYFQVIQLIFKREVLRDVHLINHKKWIKDNEERNLLFSNLSIESADLVFDIGGYQGEYCDLMIKKYKCKVYIFEPVHEYAQNLEKKFNRNSNVRIFNFGLGGGEDVRVFISKDKNKSSTFIGGKFNEEVEIKSVSKFLKSEKINYIKVMKINIEGAEYELIQELYRSGFLEKIEILLIQFHNFVPKSFIKMQEIRVKLSETHKVEFAYDFVWDKWVKNL
jgi:FkbM family methyltransferase